jgi:hypothetical protein
VLAVMIPGAQRPWINTPTPGASRISMGLFWNTQSENQHGIIRSGTTISHMPKS